MTREMKEVDNASAIVEGDSDTLLNNSKKILIILITYDFWCYQVKPLVF